MKTLNITKIEKTQELTIAHLTSKCGNVYIFSKQNKNTKEWHCDKITLSCGTTILNQKHSSKKHDNYKIENQEIVNYLENH